METTRHFVATAYIVNEGATALHEHDRLDMWLPPGGHIDRDELPHEAAVREVREETGLDVELVTERSEIDSSTARSLPEPAELLLEDIDVHEGQVAHQHIDFVFFGRVPHRELAPQPGEAPPSEWTWFDQADLEARADELAPDVAQLGAAAIDTVEGSVP